MSASNNDFGACVCGCGTSATPPDGLSEGARRFWAIYSALSPEMRDIAGCWLLAMEPGRLSSAPQGPSRPARRV